MEVDCKAKYEQYIEGDLDILSRCDAVVMLPDWKESNGAKIERSYAFFCGIPVYYYPENPPTTETFYTKKIKRFLEGYGHLTENKES